MSDEQSAAAAAFARQRAAMATEGLSCPEKAVLLVLSIMGDRGGQSHPSIETLSTRASCGRRTAFRALDRLTELGLIERQTTTGKWTWYTVRLDPCRDDTGAAVAPVPEATPTGATAAPNQPVSAKRKKTTSSPSTRAAAANVGLAVEDLPSLPAGVAERQWSDFVAMRLAMSRGPKPKPWTPGAARTTIEALTKLAAAGHDPGAVLDQSVLNGWQGVFPLKDDHHGRSDQHRRGGGARAHRDRPVDGFRSAILRAGEAARREDANDG